MPKILVHQDQEIEEFTYTINQSLLQILNENKYAVAAPCGGNGTCGKCRVKVKNQGTVSSCVCYPDSDLEVFLPNQQESRILTAQHKNIYKLPLQIGDVAHEVSYPIGLAIDIGTTSIVFYWLSLITGSLIKTVGISNPQAKYGADVISRISYCASENGLGELQSELISAINNQINIFEKKEGIERSEIVKISVAANTTMLHLLLGVDPSSLALAPFKPQFIEAKTLKASDLGIGIAPKANIHLLPSVSAFVGADILAGLASLSPTEEIKNYFFIDIGTNGEMAISTPDKIYCCATAAGPAFEGANISCGMGAFDGAISVYNSDGYQTISDEKPIGICGSGLVDTIAYLLDENYILMDGLLEKDYVLADAQDSLNGEQIVISPQDVREVQLAKSAIFSGINILLQKAGLRFENIDALYLAGGFGNFLNPESATRIGLLPSVLSDKIIPVGNTSGAGAILHLQSELFSDILDKTLSRMEYVELSNQADFEMEFAMNMFFD